MNLIEKFKDKNSQSLRNGVYYLSPLKPDSTGNFEDLYLKMRAIEGRLYDDETVKILPGIDKSHPNYTEWMIRKNSSEKLIKYISGLQKELNILELGCGNGWLSAKIANIKETNVIGADINIQELEQAERIFGHQDNLAFAYADIFDPEADAKLNLKFDIILLAGVMMYFKNLNSLTDKLVSMLNAKGEINIIDNVFYTENNIENARRKTKEHYLQMELPEMGNFVHHHLLSELDRYNVEIIYDPRKTASKVKRKLLNLHTSPFIWMKIIND